MDLNQTETLLIKFSSRFSTPTREKLILLNTTKKFIPKKVYKF